MGHPRRLPALLTLTAHSVWSAGNIHEALDIVVEVHRAEYNLWRVGICSVVGFRRTAVALWSLMETAFGAGIQITIDPSTEPNMANAVLVAQRGFSYHTGDFENPLFGDVLKGEGVASLLFLPLVDETGMTAGLLTLASAAPDAFAPADLAYFEGLGRATEAKLLSMLSEADLRTAPSI